MRSRVRLDRALSKLGLASRADGQRLITLGRVEVNGLVVTDPGRMVAPDPASITVAGQKAERAAWHTIALNKPRGTVTTRRDPNGRRTVFDVLGPEAHRLVSVGRLDMASTGLLLLTTDTHLAAWLCDPVHAVIRSYVVTARGAVSDRAVERIVSGVAGLSASRAIVLKRSNRETHLRIELTEGRNREIRRLLEAVGHEVTRLLRVGYGGIALGTLQPGTWRPVTREEVATAFPAAPVGT